MRDGNCLQSVCMVKSLQATCGAVTSRQVVQRCPQSNVHSTCPDQERPETKNGTSSGFYVVRSVVRIFGADIFWSGTQAPD